MARIIRTCKGALAAVAAAFLAFPGPADALVDDRLDVFIQAWIAKASDDNAAASDQYLKLLDKEPDNTSFSDGLWRSAIFAGDRPKAVRAARFIELNGGASEASLLLFADAIQRRDWADARSAIANLPDASNYGFLKPLLSAWLRNARGNAHGFAQQPATPLLQYYSVGQRAYFDMAAGDMKQARISVGAFASQDDEFARELRIRFAPALAAAGDRELARRIAKNLLPADILAQYTERPADKRLKKITASDGLSALYSRLAASLLEQAMAEEALALARTASWVAPHNDAAKMTLARVLDGLEYPQKSDQLLAEIAPRSAHYARAAITRIQSAMEGGRHGDAVKIAEDAARQRPAAEFDILRGQALQSGGRLAEAQAIFTTLLDTADEQRISPKRRAVYHLYLGMVLDEQGDWSAARENLERGMALDPQNPYLINYLAYTLLERREEIVASLEMLQRAHRLAPQSAAITDSLGWGYYLTGDYGNAVRYLEKAARSTDADVTIREHLGDAYWLAGRFVDARYAWRAAALVAEGDDASRIARKIDLGLEREAAAK